MKTNIRLWLFLFLALTVMSSLAYADYWTWNYTGDTSANGTINPGYYTPQVGGNANCTGPNSPPLTNYPYGVLIGNWFWWYNPCSFYLRYSMNSYQFSTRSDGAYDGIRQSGNMTFGGQLRATYFAEEMCSTGTIVYYNAGSCNGN
jgi:hypothetical protein